MRPTIEPDSQDLDPTLRACLVRTRSAVLNILVAVGFTIAVSGWLLRARAQAQWPQAARTLQASLTLGLIALGVTSYTLRRVLGRTAVPSPPGRRESRFFWSHVLPASIAALAAPLGLIYGWLIDPRLGAVIPFWVLSLALGFLAFPRARELDDVLRPVPGPGAPSQ